MALQDERPSQRDDIQTRRPATDAVDYDDPALLVRREERKGTLLGDTRVRLVRPTNTSFKRISNGVLEATGVPARPERGFPRFVYNTKHFFIGMPIATARQEHERLSKFKALAVLSSDAISSVAYGTEAILLSLAAGGSAHLGDTLFIGIAIAILLAIVATSYSQTIPAYPNGGGSYIVAKDNIGTLAGLIAAASLLIDYVLTVSVSIASGVQNLASLFPGLLPYIVLIDVALIVIVTVVNLRGVRESGTIFSLPTYLFIGSALLLIIVGIVKSFFVQHNPVIAHFDFVKATEPFGIFLILKSFASGCSAMTGVEAISNGVPAFKKPEPRNARITLMWMAIILGVLFVGTTLLATSNGIEANAASNPTVVAQIALRAFTGPLYFMFPVFQISILLVLTLAANTSYSDFPRLASLLARDNFLPHQFAFRGDRLAFSIGIIFLAILASLLVIVFKGDTTQLINLYAVGVFLSFTLSQSGMVLHWWRLRREYRGWLRSLMINCLGAITTLIVAGVISYTKFFVGAWIVIILIPLLVLMFLAIHRHYTRVEGERTTDIPIHPRDIHHRFIVPITHLNRLSMQSLAYARSISSHVTAVHVALDNDRRNDLQSSWQEWQKAFNPQGDIPLEVVDPAGRSLTRALINYIDSVHEEHESDTVTVILPEIFAPWWERFFRNVTALQLKARLFFHPGIVVTNVLVNENNQHGASDIPVRPKNIHHRFIVPVAELDRVSLQSLAYARSISPLVVAAHVAIDTQDADLVREKWMRLQQCLKKDEETQLVVIESPYRSLSRPLLAYIDTVCELYPEDTVTVILPEFVVRYFWEYLLHNQTAFQLKTALLSRPNVVVTNIPQHIRGVRPSEPAIVPTGSV